jgi:hypothetical protein
MAQLMRAFIVLLIALVAAWSVAQAAGSATMSHDMARMMIHDQHAADMVHCQGCDSSGTSDEVGSLCQLACVSPALADLASSVGPAATMLVTPLHVAMPTADLHGRSDPPDPFPPRILLLT